MQRFNSVLEVLEVNELSQYLPEFERQGITVDLLKDLSETDLKDLGLSTMAERKKLLKFIDENINHNPSSFGSTESPSAQKKVQSGNDEVIFYESVVEGLPVKVTSHRAILGPKTFLLHNISAVQVFRHEGESKAGVKIFGGLLTLVAFYATYDTRNTNGGWVFCLAIAIVLLIATLLVKDDPIVYHVQIDSSGTPSNALSSFQPENIQAVVDAINKAIINLNV